jgi:hypothetical protein
MPHFKMQSARKLSVLVEHNTVPIIAEGRAIGSGRLGAAGHIDRRWRSHPSVVDATRA